MNSIPLYIKGLDEQLEGGIPPGHVILLGGPAGSMKSTLAFNVLYHNKDKCDYEVLLEFLVSLSKKIC